MSESLTARQEYWNARTHDFTQPHARLRLIRALIDGLPRSIQSILDVGCGGAGLRGLLPDTLEYFGVDIAADVINAQHDPEHFRIADMDTARQLFGGKAFDLVVCSGICEYIQNWDPFMRLVRRSTMAKGFLILTFTNRQHYSEVILHKCFRDPHVNFMSIRQMIASLRQHGFDPQRYSSMSVRGTTLPVLSRFVSSPLNMFNRQYLFVCVRLPEP